MRRRTYLASVAAGAVAGLAGCAGVFETQSLSQPKVLEDRPDGVYFPTHVEGMLLAGTKRAGDLTVGLTYSFPHRFWNVNGTDTSRAGIEDGDDAHVMVSVWDQKTGQVVPDTGVSLTMEKGGETIGPEVVYPMLSQRMGFHYGDNFGLLGAGDYTATVEVGALPSGVDRVGSFEGRFDAEATADIEFHFEQSHLDEVSFRRTPEKAGSAAAATPMEMESIPVGRAVPKADLPGRLLGAASSDDAVLVTTLVEEGADRFGAGEDEAYLMVSARTPYNRMVLPAARLSATVGGEEAALGPTVDPEYGHHYGATVSTPESGTTVTLGTTTPPQTARHEGYETAFLQMGDVSYTV